MNIQQAYILARSNGYQEFINILNKEIDNVPETIKSDNEYIVTNKSKLK